MNEDTCIYINSCSAFYVDKLNTGFLSWQPTIKAYKAVTTSDQPAIQWEAGSIPLLQAIGEVMNSSEYFTKLALLLGQEAGRNPSSLELRADHIVFMKSICEYSETDHDGTFLILRYQRKCLSTDSSVIYYRFWNLCLSKVTDTNSVLLPSYWPVS